MHRPRIGEETKLSILCVERSSQKRRSGPKKGKEREEEAVLENVLEIETSGERLEKNVKVGETRERVEMKWTNALCTGCLLHRGINTGRLQPSLETKGERERARMEGKCVQYRCLKGGKKSGYGGGGSTLCPVRLQSSPPRR